MYSPTTRDIADAESEEGINHHRFIYIYGRAVVGGVGSWIMLLLMLTPAS